MKCVDEVVATATESRALSAFLACGSHRSPAVRAKAALAILLCVRRRCYSYADRGDNSRSSQKGRGGGRAGGGGGSVGAREMDRLLSALPRFLQVRCMLLGYVWRACVVRGGCEGGEASVAGWRARL